MPVAPLPSTPATLTGVHAEISDYYTAKVRKFGATPLGVDWTCVPTQEMRFVKLLKVCDFSAPVSLNDMSLNDLGCGYGALLTYLDNHHAGRTIDYLGIDLSQAMVQRARRLWRDRASVSFVRGHASPRVADYAVASGIFNVQREQPRDVWETFVATTLDQLRATSRLGFAVNFVEANAGTRPGVYATDPDRWSRYCADHLGAATEVIDGYGLREFTLLVRPRR